jgi:chemotaxis-related protein WspB
MLFLLLQLGQDRYALEASEVVEVLPLLNFKKILRAPPGVAGAFNYHGTPVPVIDLSELTIGIPSRQRLSTRLVLVNYPLESGGRRILGLIAEHATETVRLEPTDFLNAGVTVDEAPYLGPVAKDERGLIQWIEAKKLLSESVRGLLFRESVEEAQWS